MTTTRWVVVGAAIVALLFAVILMGYGSETRTAEQNRNPSNDDKNEAQDLFGWLDFDSIKPRLESERKKFKIGDEPLSVGYACGEEPLRIAEFTLMDGHGVRIVYELGASSRDLDGCRAPDGLEPIQELCLYSTEARALNGQCGENDVHLTGSLALGPGQGTIKFMPIVVLGTTNESTHFEVRLD